jgi:hypothetical protein
LLRYEANTALEITGFESAILTCTGFAKQAPGLKLGVLLIRVENA